MRVNAKRITVYAEGEDGTVVAIVLPNGGVLGLTEEVESYPISDGPIRVGPPDRSVAVNLTVDVNLPEHTGDFIYEAYWSGVNFPAHPLT
jgi:hypothetical protein